MKKYLISRRSEFAPKEIVVVVQSFLIVAGVIFSQAFNKPLRISVPQIEHILLILGIATLIATLSIWTINNKPNIKNLLYWGYDEHLKDHYIWSFLAFPGLIAFGEEIFFRGLLQPNLGIILTSLFACVYHIRINRNAISLITVAFFMNIIFGYLYQITENLLVPILLHYEFHIFNIMYIRKVGRSS